MEQEFSLAHLTVLGCAPPEMTYIAARAGYDYVSIRPIFMGLPGEPDYALADNPQMLKQTKRALASTGVRVHDIELARVYEGLHPTKYLPAMEVAAELGAKAVLSSIWGGEREFYIEKFGEICDLAKPFGLTVDLEYVPIAAVANLAQAVDVLRAVNRSNAGLMVDMHHLHRARDNPADLDALPREWFHFAQLCDAPAEIPTERAEMIRIMREARLYVGEGGIDVASILAHIPHCVYSIELPNKERHEEIGYAEHATRCLETLKAYLASIPGRRVPATSAAPGVRRPGAHAPSRGNDRRARMKKHIKAVDAQGRKLGGETPLLCTPLVGRTRERLLAEAANVLRQKPDIVEWRVDFFDAVGDSGAVIDTARALRGVVGKRPVIFTRRAESGGGERIAMGVDKVVELYAAVAATRLVDFIDFEMDNDPEHLRRVREDTQRHEIRLILSYHNLSYTPALDYLVDRFLEAERLGADVAMVQVMPRDRADVLRLLAATAEADNKTRIPLISMSVGPLGSVTRMVGGLFGSWLSFAVGESASAPGQIPIGDLVTVYDIIRRARGGEMF